MEFIKYPKTPRLRREVIITEKIDGTNASIAITEDGDIFTGSRSGWVTPEKDNYGFAKWCQANKDDLLKMGSGLFYGEFAGLGIQRGYNKKEKKLVLFSARVFAPGFVKPDCCDIVPILNKGILSDKLIDDTLTALKENGSVWSPGFMKPEGIIVYHTQSGNVYKVLIENDHLAKGE